MLRIQPITAYMILSLLKRWVLKMKFLNITVSTCGLYGKKGDKPHNTHLCLTTEITECSIFRCVHSREKSLSA